MCQEWYFTHNIEKNLYEVDDYIKYETLILRLSPKESSIDQFSYNLPGDSDESDDEYIVFNNYYEDKKRNENKEENKVL